MSLIFYLEFMVNFGQKVIDFLFNLNPQIYLPEKVVMMNPFESPETKEICKRFYLKYYNVVNPRAFIIGINPGRFGAGVTGIPFTDPIRLENECRIANQFPKKQELSSVFIYKMINKFGGSEKFYSRFYFTSVSPLGFVSDGKNLNYYDRKDLQESMKNFIVSTLEQQLRFGDYSKTAICLGEGKNYKFLQKLNNEMKYFERILPLPHPRFVMQYRYKRKEEYIHSYLETLNMAIDS